MVELAADDGGDLGHLLDLGQAVEAGHQRVVQARRHTGVAGLDDGLGQLLDEERHAVGAGDDGVDDLDGQDGAAAQPLDDRLDAGAAEAVEGEPGDVRVAGQRRLVLGPTGEQQQDGGSGTAIERLLDELERGRVDPVRVLEHEQHRLLAGEAEDLVDQRPERAGALGLRGQLERTVAAGAVEAQEVGEQRCRCACRRPWRARPRACRAAARPCPGRQIPRHGCSCWITGQKALSA